MFKAINEEQLVQRIRDHIAGLTRPLIVALDGRSGSGKSTLARSLAKQFDAMVIESDLFYSGGSDEQWLALPAKERAERVIDWRRIRTETLEPLRKGQTASFHSFNYAAGEGLAQEAIVLKPTPVVILDGAYSCRPELSDLIDLTVLVAMPDDDARRGRLQVREDPDFLAAWHTIWDDAEDYYFGQVRPASTFDVVVSASDDSAPNSGPLPLATTPRL